MRFSKGGRSNEGKFANINRPAFSPRGHGKHRDTAPINWSKYAREHSSAAAATLRIHNVGRSNMEQKPLAKASTRVSERIRSRLENAGKRFHANDNIAEFIEDGELDALLDEVAGSMGQVLQSLVIDTDGDHNTFDTARRVAKMYLNEVFRGRYVKAPAVTEFPNVEHLNELMIVGPITVRSACSHHFCPIIGKVWIGVMPNEHSNLIGLSKYARLTEWVMSRPQIQEEAVTQLASLLMHKMQPDGLAIIMEADHFCMHWRGVKDNESKMVNSVMRGSFLKDANLRREFLSLLPKYHKS
jgi:GTP cyclohydrolase IA